MKNIKIVGVGVGKDGVTVHALSQIEQAEVLIGAQRMLECFSKLEKMTYCAYSPHEVLKIIEESDKTEFAILMSGDVGFYSGAAKLSEKFEVHYNVELIPGISTVGALCARLKLPWHDVALVSMHGINANIVDFVRRNRRTLCLTGKNSCEIGKKLCDVGWDRLKVYVGENLGYSQECVSTMTAAELSTASISSLNALLIENDEHDSRIRTGISDENFLRGDSPMTKSEVRAVVLSKLRISPKNICYDIGCGTGSVAVEMGLACYEGHVYAIDKKDSALELARANCKKWKLGNVSTCSGLAPEALEGLPAPDTVFIGGSTGRVAALVETLTGMNKNVRIVITAIALETLNSAIECVKNLADVEIVQVAVSRTKNVAGLHMLTSENPIFVVSGGGKNEPSAYCRN